MIGGTGTAGNHGGPFLQCRKGVPPVPSVRFFDVRGGVTPGADRKGRAPSPRFSQQNDTSLRITTGDGRAGLRSPGCRVQATMVFRDLIGDVLRTLWVHKLRTFLTMFGIAWGIVSIVLMVAAGEGLRKGQEEQTRNLGKDIMIVFHGRTSLQAGGTRAGRVVHWEDTDVQAVQAEGPDCQYALPELEQNDVRTHSNYNNAAFLVTSSYPEFGDIRSLNVGAGRFYNWDDEQEGRRVAFIGTDAA